MSNPSLGYLAMRREFPFRDPPANDGAAGYSRNFAAD
jgi:hypothetical protein